METLRTNAAGKRLTMCNLASLVILALLSTAPLTNSCPLNCRCRSDFITCRNATLSVDFFDSVTSLDQYSLWHSIFKGPLPVGVFAKLSNMKKLFIYEHKNLRQLPKGLFDKNTQLSFLDMSFNALTSFPLGVENLINLKFLYLQHNKITSLQLGVFDKLRSLKQLGLEGNKITSLKVGLFDKLCSLTQLYLSDNEITSFQDGLFDKLRSLRNLGFGGNKIQTLPKCIFSQLTNLIALRFHNMPMDGLQAGLVQYNKKLLVLDFDNGNHLPFECSLLDHPHLKNNHHVTGARGTGLCKTEWTSVDLNCNVIQRTGPEQCACGAQFDVIVPAKVSVLNIPQMEQLCREKGGLLATKPFQACASRLAADYDRSTEDAGYVGGKYLIYRNTPYNYYPVICSRPTRIRTSSMSCDTSDLIAYFPTVSQGSYAFGPSSLFTSSCRNRLTPDVACAGKLMRENGLGHYYFPVMHSSYGYGIHICFHKCRLGWSSVNGRCFKLYTSQKSWKAAKEECHNANSTLAEITTQSMLNAVKGVQGWVKEDTWIDLRRPDAHNPPVFESELKDIAGPTNIDIWAVGEPNSHTWAVPPSTACAYLWKSHGFLLDDTLCGKSKQFLCQSRIPK